MTLGGFSCCLTAGQARSKQGTFVEQLSLMLCNPKVSNLNSFKSIKCHAHCAPILPTIQLSGLLVSQYVNIITLTVIHAAIILCILNWVPGLYKSTGILFMQLSVCYKGLSHLSKPFI